MNTTSIYCLTSTELWCLYYLACGKGCEAVAKMIWHEFCRRDNLLEAETKEQVA